MVSANKKIFADRVSANKQLFADTPCNKYLFDIPKLICLLIKQTNASRVTPEVGCCDCKNKMLGGVQIRPPTLMR